MHAKHALGTNFGEVVTPLDLDFSGTPVYLYFPDFKSHTAEAYKNLQHFDTNFTEKFLADPSLENCGNAFFQEFSAGKKTKSDRLFLSGSGSTFFSFERLEITDCEELETRLL